MYLHLAPEIKKKKVLDITLSKNYLVLEHNNDREIELLDQYENLALKIRNWVEEFRNS